MQETLEQIIEYLQGIWIKRRYIMISTWIICPLGWFFIAQMPNVYQSNARIYADTQSILGPLLKGLTVNNNPDVQIRLMVKTLLSRPNLEKISRMTDLDVQASSPKEYEDMIKGLKKNIKIKKTGGRRQNIFTISYENENPEMAKNVVQSVLTVFIENTLGENRTDSDNAQKFLDTQIKDYENRLSASEARLTDFKQKYSGVLPNQSGGYYNRLNNGKEKLRSIQLELLETSTQLKSAKKQINVEPITDPKNKIKTKNSIQTTYDKRIADLEATLDTLQLRYTDKYPDVKETKRQLKHLNKLRTKEIENYLVNRTKNDPSGIKILSQNKVIQEVQIQVNQLENKVASLKVREKDYKERVKMLKGKIHTLPEIEAELVALNRGYSITKEKYNQLLNRRETARLAQQADETTSKIQFKVIDPPRAPIEPSGPHRFILFGVITFIGVGVGLGISLLMSLINPVATSSSQLSKAINIPVFGQVSAHANLGLQAWNKKKTVVFMVSNAALVVVLIMFISYFLFPHLIQTPLKRIF